MPDERLRQALIIDGPTRHVTMSRHDAQNPEPEVKYLVEEICQTFQEGAELYHERVEPLVFGEDRRDADELRKSLVTGQQDIGRAYTRYFKQAGKHFAFGDCK
jgi:hypothetical protein